MEALRPSSVRGRLVGTGLAWLLLFCAGPGVLTANGLAPLAALGVALWGAQVVRPLGPRRRRALLAEATTAGLYYVLVMWWVWFVVPLGLVPIGLYMGLWLLLGGVGVRVLAQRIPVGVAVALVWLAVETARSWFAPPFGLSWLRLGHHLHDLTWLSGSARLWGLEGLTFLLAALGGLGAELLLRQRVARGTLALAGGGLATALLGSFLSAAPATEEGPRVLLVQPAFVQDVKQFSSPEVNFGASCALTFRALEEARARGEPEVDLVCWGETMLYLPLFSPAAVAAIRSGVEPAEWMGSLGEHEIRVSRMLEDAWVRGRVFGFGKKRGPGLPAGTSFLVGAEFYDLVEGSIRRRNAVVIYDRDGVRSGPASKRFLVPGAETMLGLERFESVRKVVLEIAGYVPDFVPAEETGVLELSTRDGRTFRMGTTVCFDNAFLRPYTQAVAAGPIDFHVVASNEAWYHGSCELDQMVAFSRLAALSTGRAIVRATNSGISLVIGPDGREIGRVQVDGRDRSVPGALTAGVPVPVAGEGAVPFYARYQSAVRLLALLAVLLGWLPGLSARRSGSSR